MPTTLITLPQSNLTKNSTFNTVPNPGSIALPANCTSLTCTLNMSAADQTNTGNVFSWTVYAAPPGPVPTQPPPSDGTNGNGWTGLEFFEWQGGTFTDHNGVSHPSLTVFTQSVDPQFAGGWVAASGTNLGSTFKVGATVVSNP